MPNAVITQTGHVQRATHSAVTDSIPFFLQLRRDQPPYGAKNAFHRMLITFSLNFAAVAALVRLLPPRDRTRTGLFGRGLMRPSTSPWPCSPAPRLCQGWRLRPRFARQTLDCQPCRFSLNISLRPERRRKPLCDSGLLLVIQNPGSIDHVKLVIVSPQPNTRREPTHDRLAVGCGSKVAIDHG